MSESNAEGHFGVNVWWRVPGGIKIPGEAVKEALKNNGFEESDLPMPSSRAEVSRAAYSFQNRRGRSNRRVTEKAKNTEQYSVYGILDQEVVGDEEVAFGQNTTIRYDKEANSVMAQGKLAEEFYSVYDTYKDTVIDDDIRKFLTRVVKVICRGVSKGPSGGTYFVSSAYIGIVESAQQVLDELDTGAFIHVERIVNGEQERKNIAFSVDETIDKEIDFILGAASRVEKRASAVKSHQSKMDELQELIDLYSDILGKEAQFEALMEKIQDASKTLSEKVVALQSESSPHKSPNSEKYLSAAKEVLEEEGFALHYKEITKRALDKGLIKSKSLTPDQIMCGCLSVAVKDDDERFVRVGRGIYGLANIPQQEPVITG
jgi:hypothetical protein